MHILIIKTSSLGDVVHNLPIVADIKNNNQDATIDWVVEENYVEILEMHKGIDKIIPVSIRRWRDSIFTKKTWSEITAFKKNIQTKEYDCVIDTQGLFKSGLITHLSTSKKKCGFDKKSIREPIASNFYHLHFNIGKNFHAVERNRKLAAAALNYFNVDVRVKYGINNDDIFDKIPITNALPEKYVLALHGTSLNSKLWAINEWVELGMKLNLDGYYLVLPWGNKIEKERAEIISRQVKNTCILPKMGLKSLAYVIKKSQVVVGVDTGLMHLAVALNKPAIGIYNKTNPALTGLFGEDTNKIVNLGNLYEKITAKDVFLSIYSVI
jgi:heptosyltransferase-1